MKSLYLLIVLLFAFIIPVKAQPLVVDFSVYGFANNATSVNANPGTNYVLKNLSANLCINSSYLWTFFPTTGFTISNSTASEPTVNFSVPGNYQVTFKVVTSHPLGFGACSQTGYKTKFAYFVVPYTKPIVQFKTNGVVQSSISIPTNSTVDFTDFSTNYPQSYTWSVSPSSGWSYASGTSSSSKNAAISFTNAGNYSITHTATNPGGTATITKTSHVTVFAPPSPPIVLTPISYCKNQTSTQLSATGTSLKWYNSSSGGTPSNTAPTPTTTNAGIQTFYVSQTVNNLESNRAIITVNVNDLPTSPSVISPVIYCQFATASPLSAAGSNLKWYTSASGGVGSTSASTPNTSAVGTTSYWVSQTNSNNCEGQRALISVQITSALNAPTVNSPINVCLNSTPFSLSANGQNLKWYTSSTGGSGSSVSPTPNTSIAGTLQYYVSSSGSGCPESPRTNITVNISSTPTPPPPTVPTSYIAYNVGQTASPLVANGSNLKWYNSFTGGTATTTNPTPYTQNSGLTQFFVSQTINGCESSRTLINVNVGAPQSYVASDVLAWEWLSPQIPITRFQDVKMVDANTIYACGNDGVLIKSSNGGDTWKQEKIGTLNYRLFKISNVGLNNIYVTGYEQKSWWAADSSILIKSNNAGKNWIIQKFKGEITELNFITQSSGFLILKSPSEVLYKTTDGGSTWIPQNIILPFSSRIKVDDSLNYMFYGSDEIIRTTNGGANWNSAKYYLNNITYNVYPISMNELKIITTNCYTGISNSPTSFLWSFKSNLPAGSNHYFGHFFDTQIGWIMSSDGLFKTSNGMSTWTKQSSVGFTRIHFFNQNIGIAVGNGIIYKTSNGGLTWDSKINSSSIGLSYFLDKNYVWGSLNGRANSIDGGKSWSNYTEIVNPAIGSCGNFSYSGASSLKYFDNNNGIRIHCNGVIYTTTNGGKNWNQLPGSIVVDPNLNVSTATFISNQVAWLINYTGTGMLVKKTTDGGKIWTNQTLNNLTGSDYIEESNRAQFFDIQNAWIHSKRNGTIWTTTNGGTTWIQRNSGVIDGRIHFISPNIGWAYNVNGVLKKTTDGGITWQSQINVPSYIFKSVQFTSPLIGYISGYDNTDQIPLFLKTIDGGQLWSVINSNIIDGKIHFIDSLYGWNFNGGSSGVLLRTKTGGEPCNLSASIIPLSSTTFCQGDSVILVSEHGSGNQWFLNDIPITGAANQNLTVKSSGAYSVQTSVNNGCSATSLQTEVVVNLIPQKPTIGLSGAKHFCQGDSIILSSSSLPNYQWYMNDAPIAGQNNQNLTVKLSGIYHVTNTLGSCFVASNPDTISVIQNPTKPSITPNGSNTICQGNSLVLSSSSNANNQWFKDGIVINGQVNQNISVSTAGNYTVSVSQNNCSSTSSSTSITVNSIPSVPLITPNGSAVFCQGDNVILTSSANSGNQWFKDGSILNGSTQKNLTVTTSGFYVVKTTINSCFSESNMFPVLVNPLPQIPTISNSANLTFCEGDSITLSSTSIYGNQWLLNGSPIFGEINKEIVVSNSGNYSVTTSENGCLATSASKSVVVNILPPMPQIFNNGNLSFCDGDSVSLISNAVNNNQWYLNNNPLVNFNTQKITAKSLGFYTVRVTENNCTSESNFIMVSVNPIPQTPTITALVSTICFGDSLELESSANNNQWYLNNLPILNANTQRITVKNTGNYSTTTTLNGCNSTSLPIAITVNQVPASPTITQNGNILSTSAAGAFQWFKNDTLIPNATLSTYPFVSNGSYTVRITNNFNCNSISNPWIVTNVGLNNLITNHHLRLYPNPTNKLLHVELDNFDKNSVLEIRSSKGDVIFKRVLTDKLIQPINVESLPTGVYFLRIYSNDLVFSDKFIKQ